MAHTVEVTRFQCPNCEATYNLVGVEAPPEYDRQLACLSCGAPLRNREGKFALKYFRMHGSRQKVLSGRKRTFG
jgi:hypothetical protein